MTEPHLTFAEPVYFHCPTCSAKLSIPAASAGVSGPCPHCRQMIRSPEAAQQGLRTQVYAPGPALDGGTERPSPVGSRILGFTKNWRIDDSWKERIRERRRHARFLRKLDGFINGLLCAKASIAVGMIIASVLIFFGFRYFEKRQNTQSSLELEGKASYRGEEVIVGKPVTAPASQLLAGAIPELEHRDVRP